MMAATNPPTSTIANTPKALKFIAGVLLIAAGIVELVQGNQTVGGALITSGAADIGYTVTV